MARGPRRRNLRLGPLSARGNTESSAGVIGVLAGALTAYLPRSLPLMARRAYGLELTSTLFFALALAVIDSGVLSVFAKQTYDGVVREARLNLAVGLLATMDALANVLSFFWATAAHGRPKVPMINALQLAVLAIVFALPWVPKSELGLYLLVVLALAARSCWSGIITIRPTIWRANYRRGTRARIVGRFSTVQVIVVAAVGLALGRLLDAGVWYYRAVVPVLCVLALGAVWATSRLRVRGQRAMLRGERDGEHIMKPWHGPLVVWRVLRKDPHYAWFMLWMFVLGFSNLMVNPLLAIVLREEFGLTYFASILITSSVSQVCTALFIPFWTRLLDRAHVVR